MSDEMKFAEGVWFNPPREGSKPSLLGRLSVSRETFKTWLDSCDVTEKGYVNLSILMSNRSGRPYIVYSEPMKKSTGEVTTQAQQSQTQTQEEVSPSQESSNSYQALSLDGNPEEEIKIEDVPF